METIRLTAGAKILLHHLRNGWNIAITMPDDVRRIYDDGAVRTMLRAGKATNRDFHHNGLWTGYDGLLLKAAGLIRPRGSIHVATDRTREDFAVEIIDDQAAERLLRTGWIDRIRMLQNGQTTEMVFEWDVEGEDECRSCVVTMMPGHLRMLRNLLDGGPIDHLEMDGCTVRRDGRGGVSFTKAGPRESVEMKLGGGDGLSERELVKIRMLVTEMGDDFHEIAIGINAYGAFHID